MLGMQRVVYANSSKVLTVRAMPGMRRVVYMLEWPSHCPLVQPFIVFLVYKSALEGLAVNIAIVRVVDALDRSYMHILLWQYTHKTNIHSCQGCIY